MPKFGLCWICRPFCYSLFFVCLFIFPNSYQLRVEGMLLKEEFKLSVEELKPSIECLQQACKGKIWKWDTLKFNQFPFLRYLNMSCTPAECYVIFVTILNLIENVNYCFFLLQISWTVNLYWSFWHSSSWLEILWIQ